MHPLPCFAFFIRPPLPLSCNLWWRVWLSVNGDGAWQCFASSLPVETWSATSTAMADDRYSVHFHAELRK